MKAILYNQDGTYYGEVEVPNTTTIIVIKRTLSVFMKTRTDGGFTVEPRYVVDEDDEKCLIQ